MTDARSIRSWSMPTIPPTNGSSIPTRPAAAACSRPATTSRAWRRCASPTRASGSGQEGQLKMVLSGMIVGGADLLAVGRAIHLGPLGLLGNTADDAKQTDFFKWFHLEEVGKSAGDGGTVITYAPSAPKFR